MGLAIDIELLCPLIPNWLKMNDTIYRWMQPGLVMKLNVNQIRQR